MQRTASPFFVNSFCELTNLSSINQSPAQLTSLSPSLCLLSHVILSGAPQMHLTLRKSIARSRRIPTKYPPAMLLQGGLPKTFRRETLNRDWLIEWSGTFKPPPPFRSHSRGGAGLLAKLWKTSALAAEVKFEKEKS